MRIAISAMVKFLQQLFHLLKKIMSCLALSRSKQILAAKLPWPK